MLIITMETIPGREIEPLGLVKGGTIQSKNIGRDITQGLKTIVGGELKAYTQMMNDARSLATERMVEDALSEEILLGHVSLGDHVLATAQEGEIVFKPLDALSDEEPELAPAGQPNSD